RPAWSRSAARTAASSAWWACAGSSDAGSSGPASLVGADHPVAALALGGVEGGIGARQQVVEHIARAPQGDADAQGGAERGGHFAVVVGQAFGQGAGALAAAVGQQAGELLTAQARGQVAGPEPRLHQLAQPAQQLVADQVAVGVIGALEVVHI